MPRRRGSNTITGRRTTDDGRCNGNNKKTTTTAPSSKPTKTPKESVSPSSVQSANEAPPETTQSTDLGYLHKKFKKVAAPFATTPEPAIAATATLAAAIPAEPVEESTTTTTTSTTTLSLECTVDNTKDVPDSNGSSKSKTAGRYVCPYCQHACAKPSVLEKHIRAHTNERPYPCEPCGFAFKTKSNLYKHCKSRTHVLKLEESGGTASGSIAIDPSSVEGGSDDTSDDNAMQDDSDEGEPLVPSVVPSSPDKFKTPYKPKFHLKTSTEDASSDQPVAAAAAPPVSSSDAVGSTAADGRPSAGFLQERISQIISKNQAIVETLDPIWPRRYVRQASRDKETTTSAAAAVSVVKVPPPRPNDIASPPRKTTGVAGRERSCSLSVIPLDPVESGGPSAVQLAQPSSTLLVLQEEESHRKRCRSEGPAVVTEIQLRHSVLNLLHHQPTKPPPHVINPQNPEGSIIKDILLKSRGLLPSEAAAAAAAKVDDPIPTKMSSSFTVSALLNPSTTRAPITNSKPIIIEYPNLETSNNDDPSADRPPSKRLKVSPPNDVPYPDIRPEQQRQRTSLSLFGGEVEIHDGPQRTVMRIDPIGFGESGRLSNGLDAITVTKNSGGGIVRVQPQESRISVFPVIKPTAFESSSAADSLRQTSVPYIPGIPGPYSSNSAWMPTSTLTVASSSSNFSTTTTTSASRPPLPSITVHPPSSHPEAERTDSGFDDDDQSAAAAAPTAGKFLRPNSLSLQPGTFSMKKTNMAGLDHSGQPNMLCVSGAGMTLISPETPRPRKLFRQLYLNGHAYTHLGLKCSTRVYFCCLSRAQPMYVPHHPKLSMYSQWKTRAPVAPTPGLEDSSPVQTMALYDSRQRPTAMTTSQSADHSRMILTHSSYWTNRDRPTTTHLKLEVTEDHPPTEAIQLPVPEEPPRSEAAASPPPPPPQQPPAQPKRVRIFAGGYKSTEEYTYVRGRGRGRYVCEECGIRCKKPSMLKKHIRTHTDLRPYTCRQCNFSFKTKGNLTKHMKSKAHHKKCTELGIVPVPTTVDEANIDEDSLARQETLKKMKLAGGSGNEGDSDLDDDDDDDEEDDEDEEVEGEEEEDEAEEEQSAPALLFKSAAAGQFEDAAEQPARGEREQEVARSLLDLGVMAPAGCKPTTYPYASHFNPPENEEPPAIKIPEMKEEPAPSPLPVVRAHQPMDLSTSSVAVVKTTTAAVAAAATAVANASLLGSIYSSAETIRRPLSPEEPATSGMLQAYLTEKALKEGCIKRQQVKPISSVPVSAFSSTTTTASVVVEHPVVTFLPTRLDKSRPEFVVPTTAVPMSTSTSAAFKLTDDGKTACSICNKVFTKPSQLRLHINIHYFERPFRCEACAVSFRTKGHLQKHKRSVTHFNKVNMNLTFGTPSTENPRPFKCSDCMIAFRIHGHLAKHLRSKMHIMKLECLGKLPFGTYAEMERSGINLNEIDTTDCHNSLESLQSLAHRLYKQDPSKIQQWQQEAQVAAEASLRERTISGSSEEFSDMADDGDEMDEDGEDSDGLPDGAGVDEAPPRKEESPPVPQWPVDVNSQPPRAASPPAETRRAAPPPPRAMYCSECGESCASMEAFQMHVMEKHRPPAPPSPPPPRTPVKSPPPSESLSKMAVRSTPEPGRVVNLAMESRRSPPRMEIESVVSKPIATNWNRGDLQYAQPRFYHHPATASSVLPPPSMWPPRQPPTFGDLMNLNSLSAMPPQWHQDPAAMAWIASRHMMLPPLSGHPHNYSVPQGHAHTATANGAIQQRLYSPTSSSSVNPVANEDPVFPCELCGKSFSSKETLRQHMLAHAQPRPFVCEFCDAGFTTQKLLESHLVLHRPRTS